MLSSTPDSFNILSITSALAMSLKFPSAFKGDLMYAFSLLDITTPETIPDPQNLDVHCSIFRNNAEIFTGSTSTSEMARSCQEICEWLTQSNSVPNMTTVLTGTSIVPPPEITLEEGDQVIINIEHLGKLENLVIEV